MLKKIQKYFSAKNENKLLKKINELELLAEYLLKDYADLKKAFNEQVARNTQNCSH